MWPIVSASDVADRWRPLTEAELIVATSRIADAESEIQMQLRNHGILAAPVGDALWANAYVRIAADMVRRYLLNPDAWLEETERIDDYGVTKRRDSVASSGLLYVTDDEIAKLLPFLRRKRGAFSVTLGTA